jgi:hypothetical protein
MSASYIGSFLMGQQLTALQVALDAEKAKTANLQTWASDRVKYAYPNGGTEGDERQLALSSVYITNSPFGAGVNFHSIPQYLSPSTLEWEEMSEGFFGAEVDTYGVVTYSRVESGLVVLTTKNRALGYAVGEFGAGWESLTNVQYNAAKWRIKCIRQD